MEYMFKTGFLGTKAPLFMDFVMVIVALLPFLLLGVILLARVNTKLHSILQQILFLVSVVVVGYFEYGVRVGGGYEAFMQNSNVLFEYATVVLIGHIIIALTALFLWIKTIYNAKTNFNQIKHKKDGKKAFIAITSTSLTGIWVYVLLFVA